jgi:hypothetical protein
MNGIAKNGGANIEYHPQGITSPLGNKVDSWGTTSPLGVNVCPEGRSLGWASALVYYCKNSNEVMYLKWKSSQKSLSK